MGLKATMKAEIKPFISAEENMFNRKQKRRKRK